MLLEVKNLEIVYNDVIRVVRGISFQVPDKVIVALLGSNGAGKSSVLKAISRLLELEEGEVIEGSIEFRGERIDRLSPEEVVERGIVQVPEGRGIFDDLTTYENIRIGAYTRKDRAQVRAEMELVFNYFPVLRNRRFQLAGYLSGGEQQMLAISRALMTKCRLMMLDEPSLGLAPQVTKEIFRILARIHQEEGTSLLLVEQNARLGLMLASYGYVLENGQLALEGKTSDLLNNEDVKKAYLGV